MAIVYSGTTDPDIVDKYETTTEEIDLSVYITEYLSIKNEYLALPELKTVPDAETLRAYNEQIGDLINYETEILKIKATALYNQLQPIYDAGLLPAQYNDEYAQLVAFINS